MKKFAIVEINENGSIMYRYDGETYGKKVWQELTEEEIENILEDFKPEKYHNDATIEKLKEILK